MSILKVARMGHPVLRERARPVGNDELLSAPIQALLDDMIATMQEYRGVGLAAPQVHVGLRVFVAALDDAEEGGADGGQQASPVVIVNPELRVTDPSVDEDWEGCLSIPDIRGRVPRARALVLRALDRTGAPFEIGVSQFPARVIQHETDHLDGILFFDRMRDFSSLTFLDEFARFWREDD